MLKIKKKPVFVCYTQQRIILKFGFLFFLVSFLYTMYVEP